MSIAICVQVYHVRNKMDSVGLDMLLDIHGDEELPYNFINGNEVSTNLLYRSAVAPFPGQVEASASTYWQWRCCMQLSLLCMPVPFCVLVLFS